MKKSVAGWTILFAMLFLICCKNNEKGQTSGKSGTGYAALDSINELISKNPRMASYYAARAQIYVQKEDYNEAIQDMAKAMSIDSNNLSYHYILSDIYLNSYDAKRALDALHRAAALYPDSVSALLKLSKLQLILFQHNESLESIRQILLRDPQNTDAYMLMGLNLKEMGETKRSIFAYQKCVDLNSDKIDCWLGLAAIYDSLNNPLAVKYFENALRIDSNNINAHHMKAQYYQNRDNYEEALLEYKKTTDINPNYTEGYYNSGVLYYIIDSLQQSRESIDKTIRIDPNNAMAYYYLGLIELKENKNDAALEHFKKALSLEAGLKKAEEEIKKLEKGDALKK